MNPGFVAIAALLALAAGACVALPLVLRRSSATATAGSGAAAEMPTSPVAAAVVSLVLLGGAAGLYATWSDWRWPSAEESSATTPAEMVSKLARRLEQQPDDVEGWLMLGRSHTALGQYPLAIRAFQRADRLEDGHNVEALTGWAEALALSDQAELEGRAGRLFEKALALEPNSPKALFFSAVAAQRRGELPLALQRFETMLAGGPPDNVRPLLEQQVVALKAAIAGTPLPAQGAGPPGPTAGAAASAAGVAPAATAGTTGGATSIQVRVRVAPAIAGRVAAGAPLFVFVRAPGRPGPPLAVKRLAATLPQRVELTPADAMMGGDGFAPGDKVEVTARISLGGQPTATSGDPFGVTAYEVGRDGEKELVIDRLTP